MRKEKLEFAEGTVEVTVDENLIYLKVIGSYSESVAAAMTLYLDKVMEEIQGPTIRVWDARGITGNFTLTSDFVSRMAPWAEKVAAKYPEARAYFIVDNPLIFGITRMYEMQAEYWGMSLAVLSDIEQLPEEVRKKIPA